MKKILITGGTGFVGANFVHRLVDTHEVHLLVRPNSNFWRIEKIRDKVKLHNVDLFNAEEIEKFFADLKPEIIFHFATYGAYPGREQDPKLMIETNVLGTVNLLNAASKIKFECFINTGSSSEYGEKQEPIREDMIIEPNNLYGVTKAAATHYATYLARKMNLPIVTMRIFSAYGYFEDKNRLFPAILRSYLKNTAPNLTSPTSVRDFIFIEDIVDAYLRAAERIDIAKGNVLNLGTGFQKTVGEVVEAVKEILGSDTEPLYGTEKPTQYEPRVWVADMTKTRKILGWEPKFSLRNGLESYLKWFKENLNLYE